jgi:3-oxoacyl-[acyl-carrier protein] reductase
MKLGLQGKVAMVGGASRGLGFNVARLLAIEGAQVSIASRDAGAIADAAGRIHAETGVEALALPVDLRQADGILQWQQATLERFGGIDLLFTNTGGPPNGTFLDFDDAAWQDTFDLLVMSVIRMVRGVIPSMRERGGGSIVMSTSSSVKEPIPHLTLSTVIRASVSALSKTLANELAPDRIRVNQLIPGRILTDRIRQTDQHRAAQTGQSLADIRRQSEQQIPLGRLGDPEEYARGALFLLSDAASYITGATLQVDGGLIRSVT